MFQFNLINDFNCCGIHFNQFCFLEFRKLPKKGCTANTNAACQHFSGAIWNNTICCVLI